MKFTELSDINLSRVDGSAKQYICDKEIEWECGAKGSGFHVFVSAGKPFDVSVPNTVYSIGKIWPFRWMRKMAHNTDILLAAAIHDETLLMGLDGDFCSSEFRRALRARGLSKFKARALFYLTLWATGHDRSKYRESLGHGRR